MARQTMSFHPNRPERRNNRRSNWIKTSSLTWIFKLSAVTYTLSVLFAGVLRSNQQHNHHYHYDWTSDTTVMHQFLKDYENAIAPTTLSRLATSPNDYNPRRRQMQSTLEYIALMNTSNPAIDRCTACTTLLANYSNLCSTDQKQNVLQISTMEILHRDPSRIPTYVEDCILVTYFGYVFRDLVHRLFPNLPIPIPIPIIHNANAQRHSLIVSDDAVTASKDPNIMKVSSFNETESKWHQVYGYNVPASIYISAKLRGYSITAWEETIKTNNNNNNNTKRTDPHPFLFILVDPSDITHQDELMKSCTFLEDSSPDFLVYRVVVTPHATYGEQASTWLLEKGYRLQILSVSHTHAPAKAATASPLSVVKNRKSPPYGPNKILATTSEVKKYFKYVRTMLLIGGRNHYPLPQKTTTNRTTRTTDSATFNYNLTSPSSSQVFVTYLMATKSFTDMAIPSAEDYVNLTGKETADVVLNVDGDGIPYQSCRPSVASIQWKRTTKQHKMTLQGHGTTVRNKNKTSTFQKLHQQQEVVAQCSHGKPPETVWFSGPSPAQSEGACTECHNPTIHVNPSKRKEQMACITRFLPKSLKQPPKRNSNSTTDNNDKQNKPKPNILLLRLEQVSRDRFRKLLPMTRAVLEEGGAWPMEHFMASSVDPAEALKALAGDDDQGTSALPKFLHKAGYATLNVANGCNSSILFQHDHSHVTWYGSQLNDILCRRMPTRPNCLGSTSAAQHVLNYTQQFLQHYTQQHNQSWAAFVSFVEGRRDETYLLPGTLDQNLSTFLRQLQSNETLWNDTMVAFVSDMGVIRGSFAMSFTGQQEMVQPLLYLKAPSNRGSTPAIQRNQKRYMTVHDLRRTIESVVVDGHQTGNVTKNSSDKSVSLFTTLPETRRKCRDTKAIPNIFCDWVDPSKMEPTQSLLSLHAPPPPSMLSFYVDIPKQNRAYVHIEVKRPMPDRAAVTDGCYCATNIDRWYNCNTHPWNINSPTGFKEYFMLVDCPNQPTHLELRVVRNQVLIKRAEARLTTPPSKPLPDIIFLELDSVSGPHADRHFPKTREFLKRYRIKQQAGGKYECLDGVCSADFTEHVTLAGANSIPNQVAALSGCIASDFNHMCGIEAPEPNMYCNDTAEPHFGLQIHRVRMGAKQIYWCPPQPGRTKRVTPWMFGVTDSLGYINYFGEEFCYEGSPYVTQGNVFPAFFSDISPHSVFCRLAEQQIRRENVTVADEFRWGFEKQDQACVNSDASDCNFEKARISLELMEQVWNVYPDRPKFAFLNVLAAHVYNADWSKVYLAAERYDDHLLKFLENMVSREDFGNTIIVVRSDHGLQRGPTSLNYNLQIEHTRPWTGILVSESFTGLSKEALFKNQRRLTSGFDLYHTLRSHMEIESPTKPQPPLANWSYDLLSATVPAMRTCHEARVDDELCRLRSIVPSFGICNTLETKQSKFCRNYEVKAEIAPEDRPVRKSISNGAFVTRPLPNKTRIELEIARAASLADKRFKFLLNALNKT